MVHEEFKEEQKIIKQMEQQLRSLQVKISKAKADLNDKKPSKGLLAKLVTCRPFDFIRSEKFGQYEYESSKSGDGWSCMIKLAREIHQEFKFQERIDGYIEQHRYLPKIEELTNEQIKQSAEMISEISQIYNKYFIANHPKSKLHTVRADVRNY